MRARMGLHKNEHGIWQVRRKVPKRLEQAVARVLENGKKRQPWLSRSLRTGDVRLSHVASAQGSREPRLALLTILQHTRHGLLKPLRYLAAHLPDAVFVLVKAHAGTHRLHRCIIRVVRSA